MACALFFMPVRLHVRVVALPYKSLHSAAKRAFCLLSHGTSKLLEEEACSVGRGQRVHHHTATTTRPSFPTTPAFAYPNEHFSSSNPYPNCPIQTALQYAQLHITRNYTLHTTLAAFTLARNTKLGHWNTPLSSVHCPVPDTSLASSLFELIIV